MKKNKSSTYHHVVDDGDQRNERRGQRVKENVFSG